MVLSMCLCVWRILGLLFLLCAYQQPDSAGAESHQGDELSQESGRQPATDGQQLAHDGQLPASNSQLPAGNGQHHPAKDSPVSTQENAKSNANSPMDKPATKGNPAISKVPQEGAPTDNAPATDEPQAVGEVPDNQLPDNDGQLQGRAQSADIQSTPGDRPTAEATSGENIAQHNAGMVEEGGAETAKPGGGAEDAEIGKEAGKSMMDEPTLGRPSTPQPVNIQIDDILKAEMLTQQQAAFKEEELGIPDSVRENAQQDSSDAKTDGSTDSSSQVVPELEGAEEEVEADTRTQQINREASPVSLNKVAAADALESQEVAGESPQPAKTVEEVPQDIHLPTEPLKEEGLLAKDDTSSEKDPGPKPVEGASDDKGSASKDSVAPDDIIPKEAVKESDEVQTEIPKDAEKPDVVQDKEHDVKEAVEKIEVGEDLPDGGPKPDATQEEEEEMPSFDEWKQKMLEQHEQERQHGQAGQGAAVPPPRPFSLTENSKNHASSDCGAKILNVNKEAQNAPAILQANRDVYTLNPCTANIWFTVELCEPIQVKHLEIANYELFSSVPESFRVSISDRFPTREWRQIGTFHAREERSLQSFPVLEEQMFAKYMRIEMLTFFGSEHYCPLSTLRVFGTSMVEEIDEEDITDGLHQESEVLPAHPAALPEDGDLSLLQSAKGLVRNLMNAITGNGEPAAPCENKNKSRTKSEEMLPCMPQDKPKVLRSPRSNQWTSAYLFQAQTASGYSLDPAQFRRECQGSTRCFSPNYGQTFQDCCIKEIAASSSYTTHNYLYCQESIDLSLYHSPLDPSLVKKDSLQSHFKINCASQKERKPKLVPGEVEVQEKSTTEVLGGTEKDAKQRTPNDRISPGGEGGNVKSSSSSSEPSIQRRSELQVKATPSLPDQEVTTAEGGVRMPHPTPSLKATCTTVPVEPPPVVLDPPISQQPTPAEEEPDLQLQVGGVNFPAIEPPSMEEDALPVKEAEGEESSAAGRKADASKAGQQNSEAGKEPQDSGSSAEPPKSPDPAAAPDQSRKADATGKEPDRIPALEEAVKNSKAESKDALKKVDPAAKTQENLKPEPAGKGAKMIPEAGTNGAGGLGSIAQKESVFMRLNNRIKSLELNMSLSSRYLEELSLRYRKQMDEMQKAFNKTIKTLTENARKAEEKDQKQQEYITRLEGQMSEVIINVETTSQRLNGLHKEVIERHLFFLLVEILLMIVLFLVCRHRFRRGERPLAEQSQPFVVRSHDNGLRRSLDNGLRRSSLPLTTTPGRKGKNNNSNPLSIPPAKKRKTNIAISTPRVSERTISGGSCDDLLIIGPSTPFLESLKQANESTCQKSKSKAKHKPLQKSISNSPLQHGHRSDIPPKRATKMTVAGLLFRGPAYRGGQAPPYSPTNALHRTVSAEDLPTRVQEVKGGAPPIRQQQQHLKVSGKSVARKHGAMMNGRR